MNQGRKYQQRKKLITIPDDKLIRDVCDNGRDYQDRLAFRLISAILQTMRWEATRAEYYFKKVLHNKVLLDIGCGEGGAFNALRLKGYYRGYEDSDTDLGITDIVLLDPYITEEYLTEKLDDCMCNICEISKEDERIKIRKQIKFAQEDGLSFLLKQEPGSANVITSHLQYVVIPNEEYLRRMAQEIFRVVPEDGVFISANSDEIEEEAKELFTYERYFVPLILRVFSNTPIPSDDDMVEEFFADLDRRLAK